MEWLHALSSPATVFGLACWLLSTLLWISVLARAPLSFVYCLGATNYLLVPLAARTLFGEQLTRPHLAGMVLIAAGVALILAAHPEGPAHVPR